MPLAKLLDHARARAKLKDSAHRLYYSAVQQARQPPFYAACGVADTLDGRFDLIVLHVSLALRRLERAGPAGDRLTKAVMKVMFDDLDQNLREMGVGDLGVGKRVKQMARAYYGRALAYGRALDAGDAAAHDLEDALRRNLFAGNEPAPAQLSAVADYVRATAARLADQDEAAMLVGRLSFADPPSV